MRRNWNSPGVPLPFSRDVLSRAHAKNHYETRWRKKPSCPFIITPVLLLSFTPKRDVLARRVFIIGGSYKRQKNLLAENMLVLIIFTFFRIIVRFYRTAPPHTTCRARLWKSRYVCIPRCRFTPERPTTDFSCQTQKSVLEICQRACAGNTDKGWFSVNAFWKNKKLQTDNNMLFLSDT